MAENEKEQLRTQEIANHARIQKQQCTEAIDFKRAERIEKHRGLEMEENETRDRREQLKKLEEQLRQTEVRTNRLDVELENVLKKLAEEYGLSYELAGTAIRNLRMRKKHSTKSAI